MTFFSRLLQDVPMKHRPTYPLFTSHLDLSKQYWKTLLQPNDTVIDATCGNGHDTLFLSQLIPQGKIIAIDVQLEAIEKTKDLLAKNLKDTNQISFYHQSHATFPSEITEKSVKLIVYNLGYLPGSDKKTKTIGKETIESIRNALKLIAPGGAICLTCYPGHPEGKEEEALLIDYTSQLNPMEWSVSWHRWVNRNAAPSLLLIQAPLQIDQ